MCLLLTVDLCSSSGAAAASLQLAAAACSLKQGECQGLASSWSVYTAAFNWWYICIMALVQQRLLSLLLRRCHSHSITQHFSLCRS